MDVDCGDCQDFVDHVEQALGGLISKYGFHSVECASDLGGRECRWMLESERCRMLFTLMDGAEACSLGRLDTPSPGMISFYLNGEVGWYNALWLIELKQGKQLLTRKLINRMWEGKLDYFEWLAPMLKTHLDELIEMFSGEGEFAWHDDLVEMLEKR